MRAGSCSFLCVFLCLTAYQAFCQNKSSVSQLVRNNVVLPKEAGKSVLRLFLQGGQPTVATDQGVFRYSDGKWIGKPGDGRYLVAVQDNKEEIWLASQTQLRDAGSGQTIVFPAEVKKDSIHCLFWANNRTLYVGTNKGLFSWSGQWSSVSQFRNSCVNDIMVDAEGTIWVATPDGLWRRKGTKWVNLDETLMAVGNERRYFALALLNNGKDLVFSSPKSIACVASDGDHWALSGAHGLPYGPAKLIRSFDNRLWLGTDKGAILKDSAWHYYAGKRWLPGDTVVDILEVAPGVTWIATKGGISELREQQMTLEQKAGYYEKVIDERHNRRGLINISKLARPGDITSSYTENEDNDGLWTSCYLAAECFRYAATKSLESKALAIRTFEALERLEMITGIPGYPARSYALATDQVAQSRSPHPKKWHPSPDGKWQWLDDTSSDEITGHLFTLSLFYELVADEVQKKRVVQLIDRIVTHILDNNYHLIDLDGKPTRWGVWHPDSLNHSPNWATERGLNSLQMLSHLKTASHYTGDAKYEAAYQKLVREHGFAQNALQAKVYGPYETSHSDDILNFFPYYGLFHYTSGDTNRQVYIRSLERTWKVVSSDRMPAWNVMASVLLQRDCGLTVARRELEDYPLDLIDWTMTNNQRWDLVRDPLGDRGNRTQAIHPIPTPESGISRWNTNPKRLDVGNGGRTEETGTYFLFAYWMGRYYGFWE